MNLKYNLSRSLFIKTFCVFVGLTFIFHLNAQDLNKKKILNKARKALYNEKYVDAQNFYLQLVNSEPTNDIYNYEAGLSYYLSTFKQTKSIPFFEAAIANTKEDTIVELYYYLGKAYQLNSEFEKANTVFNIFDYFIEQNTKSGKILKNNLIQEKNYNNNGIDYTSKKNNNIIIQNLGEKINTIDREYAPVLSTDKDVILFTSRRKINGNKIDKTDLLPYEDIYVVKKTNNEWALLTDKLELKKYLPDNVNTKKHDASITYSTDGKTIYTYKKDAIWQANYTNDNWSTLKKLDDKINSTKFNVPSVTLSSDGNTMFFVTVKKNGIGGKDIYKSVRESDGKWNSPSLLSTKINTIEDEDGPFLTQDGKTLYFSSRGHSSIGGYDFFKSELINGEWNDPINIGIPYNSPADDIFFVIDNTNEMGYFSSSRVEGNGSYDIYGFSSICKNLENIEIRGLVYNKTDKQPLKSTIELTNLENSKIENTSSSLITNGKFLILAKPENNYKLTIHAEGFTPQNVNITIPKQCDYYQLFTEIQLEKTKINGKDVQIATLYNSFFNRNDLTETIPISTLEIEGVKNQIPSFKDESDNNYEADIEFIAKTRKLNKTDTPNFSIVSDTIDSEIIVVNTTNTTNNFKEFGPIYFDFDKNNLSKEAKKELDNILSYLKTDEGKNTLINITGHSDGKRDLELNQKIFSKRKIPFTKEAAEQRSKSYNLELSKQRAEKSATYLKNKGVKSTQLIIEYIGEENPTLPNINNDGTNNIENQKLNRKVTIKITKQSVL